MNWETKRKLVYALGVSVALLAIFVLVFRNILFPDPTCFDSKLNGYELEVDCGGACALKCTQEVNPLTVVWAKAVSSSAGIYDLVGMVKNTNIDNASRELGYTFTLYDDQGAVTSVYSGSTTAPLDGNFPIIIQNLPLTSAPNKVALTLFDGLHFKVLESPTSPTLRIVERRYEPGQIPRIYTTIMNTKRLEINNLQVRVVLFDENDNAYAVAQTIVPTLAKEEIKELAFTWNEPLPVAPTRIGVYPIFNPFEAIDF